MQGTTLPSYVTANFPSPVAFGARCPPTGARSLGFHANSDPRPAAIEDDAEIEVTPIECRSSNVASTSPTLLDITTIEQRTPSPKATARAIALRVRRWLPGVRVIAS